jgi:ATP-dependent Clp protease ATP-binding subunit ClpA
VQAQEEARQARHDHIGPEHIVLGLLHEPEAPAARAIEALGVSLDAVRESVAGELGPAAETVPVPIPFTPQSRKALELTHREALRLGHDHIGTEHLLLGVLSLGEGPGVAALERLNITRERAEQQVRRFLDS